MDDAGGLTRLAMDVDVEPTDRSIDLTCQRNPAVVHGQPADPIFYFAFLLLRAAFARPLKALKGKGLKIAGLERRRRIPSNGR